MLVVKEPFSSAWKNKDAFEEVEKLSGEVSREVKTRKTLRFDFSGKSYYLKLHHGITYTEALKNFFQFRKPVLGADQEWQAINRLRKAGVDTMNAVAFGEKGFNPVKKTSFIITEDLSPTISLEDYCKDWSFQPPPTSVKRLLIERVAMMVRKMHAAGVNHRDCYICHFLLHLPFNGEEKNLKLSVIDLHRAQCRRSVPTRWRDKDLIGLFYSVKNIGLTTKDYFRFLKEYFQLPLRTIFKEEKKLLYKMIRESFRIRAYSVKKGYEKILLGKVVGEGTERICYENLSNSKTCFKVSHISSCKQTRREIRYLYQLVKQGNYPDFFPKFYGEFTTKHFVGIEQEYLKDSPDTIAISIRDYLKSASEKQIKDLEARLSELKAELLSENIIVNDMRPCNTFLLLHRGQSSIYRIVFIDGFGPPELIPISAYIPVLGRKKILRQWSKFQKKFDEEKVIANH